MGEVCNKRRIQLINAMQVGNEHRVLRRIVRVLDDIDGDEDFRVGEKAMSDGWIYAE